MPTFCSPKDYIAARRVNVTESRKLEFTEGWIRGLDPAPKGKRVAYSDMIVQGLRLRVNDQGEKIFSVVYRLRGDSSGAPKTLPSAAIPTSTRSRGRATRRCGCCRN